MINCLVLVDLHPVHALSLYSFKVAIFVVVLVCIIIIIYYLFCYYAGEDDFLGESGNVSVGWNIEDMIDKIHHRQKINLSRLSRDAHYNI